MGEVVVLVSNLDIVQFEIVGTLQGQEVVNVFQYEVLHSYGGFIEMDSTVPLWFIGFDADVLSNLSVGLSIHTVRGKNLSAPIHIYEAGVTANGDRLGEPLPVHDTFSMKLIRTNGITRNGRKSYSGVTEETQSNGAVVLDQVDIDAMELWHSSEKVITQTTPPSVAITWRPVIVGRTKDVNGVYQLDLSKINTIQGAQLSTAVRTQNSRKP